MSKLILFIAALTFLISVSQRLQNESLTIKSTHIAPKEKAPTAMPKNTISVSPKVSYEQTRRDIDTWKWSQGECGSSAPCTYRACLNTDLNQCYSCTGFYDKSKSEGERIPMKNEDPRDTKNFNCKKEM